MRKIVKSVLAFTLAAAMVVQPASIDFSGKAITDVSAAVITDTDTVPQPQTRLQSINANTEWKVGATMPYFRYDTSPASVTNSFSNVQSNLAGMDSYTVAYQDNYTGTKKSSTNWAKDNIASQASNQSYVELAAGKSITFTMVNGHGGDGVTVRYTLPDGSGSDSAGKPIGQVSNIGISTSNGATVLGYNNEDTSQRYNTYMTGNKVKITSDYMWQYFGSGNPTDNNSGTACFAFDEVHFRLSNALQAGDTITITNTGSVTMGVDFIEVETTQYIPAPSGAVVVPAGSHTQSQLESYITQAERRDTSILYFEAGVHYMPFKWTLAGGNLKITGAGIWHTKMQFTKSGMREGGIVGEKEGWCRGVEFCNMYINSNLHSRFDQQANYKCFADLFAEGCSIHDVWEEHFECGFWIGRYSNTAQYPMSNLKIYNNRIRNNFADGVNLCQGTRDTAVYNNDSRNNGDDGLAMWNATDFQPDDEYRNIFAYNTVEFIWRAGAIAIYGGEGHKVYNNLIRDTFMAAGIHLNTNFSGHQFNNTTNISFENNVLIRTGTYSDSWNESLGAVDIHGGVKNVTFKNTEMYDIQNNGIRTFNFNGSGVSFTNTVIFGVGLDGQNDTYSCPAHSATAVRQSSTSITYNNFLVKNVVPKYVSESADKHWPYYCDDAGNLPTIPTAQSRWGNTNYSFYIDSSGNYKYDSGAYLMNGEAYYTPGYDLTIGKNLRDPNPPQPTTPAPATTRNPDDPTPAPTQPQPTTAYDPYTDGVVLSTANSSSQWDNKGLQDVHSWNGVYQYQGLGTFTDATDEYKYLAIAYDGDIDNIRLELGGDFYWFNPAQEPCFLLADGTDLPASSDGSTVYIIDLEASGLSGSDFQSFHIHSGTGVNESGSVDITTAVLLKTIPGETPTAAPQPTTAAPQPTTQGPTQPQPQPTTAVIPTTRTPGPQSDDDIILNCDGASFIGDYTTDTSDAYKYKWVSTNFDDQAPNSNYRYLTITYSGDITNLRIQLADSTEDHDRTPYLWFDTIDEDEDNIRLTAANGQAIPLTGTHQTVCVDLAAAGIDLGTFDFGMDMHRTNGKTSGGFVIENAVLSVDPKGSLDPVTQAPTTQAQPTSGSQQPTTQRPQPTTQAPTQPVDPLATGLVLSTANSTSAYDNKGLQDVHSWNGAYQYQGLGTFPQATNAYKYLAIAYEGPIDNIRLELGGDFYWFNNDQDVKFVTYDGSELPATGDGTLYYIDLAASGLTGSDFQSFHIHSGTGVNEAGSVDITTAVLTETAPEIVEPVTQAPGVTYDLQLAGLSWDVSDIKTGNKVTLSAAIKNAGPSAIAAGTQIPVRFTVDGTTTVATVRFAEGLAAGKVAIVDASSKWTATIGGHTFGAAVDANNALGGDTNLANNSASKKVNVTYSPNTDYTTTSGVDFAVTDLTYVNTATNEVNGSVSAGDTVRFVATITNVGTQTVPAGSKLGIQFQINGNTSGIVWNDELKQSNTSCPQLAPGESVTLTSMGGNNDNGTGSRSNGTWVVPGNNNYTITAWVNDTNNYAAEYGGYTAANNYRSMSLSIPVSVNFNDNVDQPDDLDAIDDDEIPTQAPTSAPQPTTQAPTQAPTTGAPTTQAPTTVPGPHTDEDIVLNCDGASMIGDYTTDTSNGYKYKWVSTNFDDQATDSHYRYLTITYSGDITNLRVQFADSTEDHNRTVNLWYDTIDEDENNVRLVSADGNAIPLVGEHVTVCVDLAANNIDLGTYDFGMDMHRSNGKATGGFVIENAVLSVDPKESTEPATVAPTTAPQPTTQAPTTEPPTQAPTYYNVSIDGDFVASVKEGNTYKLPSAPIAGYAFGGKMYKVGSSVTVNGDMNFESVEISSEYTLSYLMNANSGIQYKMEVYGPVTSDIKAAGAVLVTASVYKLFKNVTKSLAPARASVVTANEIAADGTFKVGLAGLSDESAYIEGRRARAYLDITYTGNGETTPTTVYATISDESSLRGMATITRNSAGFRYMSNANKEGVRIISGIQ